MTQPGYPEPPVAGTEAETVLGSLERQRATFAYKTEGLDVAGLRTTIGASSVTLGGLLKHLAFMEHLNFSRDLRGDPLPAPYADVDWSATERWDYRSAAGDPPELLYRLWAEAVARSRSAVAAALAEGGLDQPCRGTPHAEPPSLRRLLADMVEEYARHTGHADLIREAVDGRVGEDPPGPAYPYRLGR